MPSGQVAEKAKPEDRVDAAIRAVDKKTGFDGDLAWIKRRYRGVTYKMVELEIGVHKRLVEQATSTRPNPDTGANEEVVDRQLLDSLIRRKVIVEPTDFTEVGKGTRLMSNLQRDINELLWGDEKDESLDDEDEESEGDSSGNG